MSLGVASEVGALRQVIVHRPGLELDRLTPDNTRELLFDDVLWADRARAEHDAFTDQLRTHDVVVHRFVDLLTTALDQPGARDFLQEHLTTATRFGPALDRPLDILVSATPAAELAERLIGGILTRDVADSMPTSSLLMDHLGDHDFLLPPLPNHLYQRDNATWIHQGLSINPMSHPARRRETINTQVVYNFHPMFTVEQFSFLYGNDSRDHFPATVEGGDIAVLGRGTVLVGVGERTTPQGVEYLTRQSLQAAAYQPANDMTFDILGAQTEGMIGYLLERELRNQLGSRRPVATLLTMIEVDADDPAFEMPTKFVGPVYSGPMAPLVAEAYGWPVLQDGDHWRRVVPSPAPRSIVELTPLQWLLERRTVVICAGGGGIPTIRTATGELQGVEAVIDKDRASAVLAQAIGAEMLLILTDVEGIIDGWGTAQERVIAAAPPTAIDPSAYPAGSMGPKVQAACTFAESGGDAVIGSLADIGKLVGGTAGTLISRRCTRLEFRDRAVSTLAAP
jgi:carbamate kinase